MKNKIAFKITSYILVVALISTLTVGAVFIQMFKSYTFNNRTEIMLERARNISELVSSSLLSGGQMRGMGGLMRFINTMSEADVWIFDPTGKEIQITGKGMMGGSTGIIGSDQPLPEEAREVIKGVLAGKESVGRGFSGVYNEATLTVAVPIRGSSGEVIGGVLLNSPIKGITQVTNSAFGILGISIGFSLLLAIGAAYFFSKAISKPLLRMNGAAKEMAKGNYEIRTEIKRTDELGQLSESLDRLATELGETMAELETQEKLRQDFVANVSHEFRTPLTIIQGSLEALLDKTIIDETEKEDFIRRMLGETKGLERLVRDLLDLSKLQLGTSSLNMEELSISEIITDVTRNMKAIAEKKGVRIHVDLSEKEKIVIGDYDRIVQLIKIFVDNSIKFAYPDTELKLVVGSYETSSSEDAVGRYLRIVIEDQGVGISEEDLPRVWDRFYKGEKSRTKDLKKGTEGTGLGLAIAKEIVEAHQGKVRLSSKEGEGTRIEVLLPKKSVD